MATPVPVRVGNAKLLILDLLLLLHPLLFQPPLLPLLLQLPIPVGEEGSFDLGVLLAAVVGGSESTTGEPTTAAVDGCGGEIKKSRTLPTSSFSWEGGRSPRPRPRPHHLPPQS